MCVKRFDLNSAKFLSNLGLTWQAALKNTRVKFDLSTAVNMLLMVEKDISTRNMSLYLRYAKAQNKYMKDYDKGKEFSYLEYWDVQAFSK